MMIIYSIYFLIYSELLLADKKEQEEYISRPTAVVDQFTTKSSKIIKEKIGYLVPIEIVLENDYNPKKNKLKNHGLTIGSLNCKTCECLIKNDYIYINLLNSNLCVVDYKNKAENIESNWNVIYFLDI